MMADRVAMFWTTIMFVVFVSTCFGLNGDEGAVCSMNVSVRKSRLIEYTETYPTGFPYNFFWLGHGQTGTRRAHKIVFDEVWEIQQTQCPDYEDKNGTCTPDCSTTCPNSYCAQPNICRCNYGWSGNSCDMPLVCFVRINSTEAMSELSALENIQSVSGNLSIHQMLPECNLKCRKQLNTTADNVIRSADGIFYLIPIDPQCDTTMANLKGEVESVEIYNYVIVAVAVIIILLAITVCIVCVVRRKRRIRNKEDDNQTEPKYDDVGPAPIREYDDIANVESIHEYDNEGMSIYEYDYVDVNPRVMWIK